jgi:hypothetical protein
MVQNAANIAVSVTEDVELNISELEIILPKIFGGLYASADGKQVQLVQGMIDESNVSERIKRRLNKIGRRLEVDWKSYCEQRAKIEAWSEVGKTVDEIKDIRDAKLAELADDNITVSVEKIDFQQVADVALKGNYQILYDKFFINTDV